jgi:hypothetical protein
MSAGGTEGDGKSADQAGDTVGQRAVAQMEALRGQGYGFRDIAAVLERRGLILSPECIRDILERWRTCERKE